MKDYIIVGFGIAGISLARVLEAAGKSFIVIDGGVAGATQFASGLCNPVFIRHLKKVWHADEAVPAMKGLYGGLEADLRESLFSDRKIYKILKNDSQTSDWTAAGKRISYIGEEIIANDSEALLSPSGLGTISGGGLLNVVRTKARYHEALKEKGLFLEEAFDYSRLIVRKGSVSYRGVDAKSIVFAQGMGVRSNPFFDKLPLKGNKGEWIVIRTQDLPSDKIIYGRFFIIPLGGEMYKVGATYQNDYADVSPSEEAKNHLLKGLETFFRGRFTVEDHQSGIRPTVADRRPLLGRHPQHANVYVFNGLGSRGILNAPYLAEKLYLFMEGEEMLPAEADISRYG